MITEDYVSFETAKLLKEKGFEYNPDESYWLIDANNIMYWISCIGAYDYVDVPTESFQRPKNGYRLVTQAMAMKWLREKNIIINVWYNGVDWDAEYYNDEDENFYFITEPSCNSYEEACEAAIKYCLENLI
jgi:hypothetical protein